MAMSSERLWRHHLQVIITICIFTEHIDCYINLFSTIIRVTVTLFSPCVCAHMVQLQICVAPLSRPMRMYVVALRLWIKIDAVPY